MDFAAGVHRAPSLLNTVFVYTVLEFLNNLFGPGTK
jgi:hypothetical protein